MCFALKQQSDDIKNQYQFEALFDHATIGIIVTDDKGTIINFNKYAETQFGYTKEELSGKSIETLVPSRFQHSHVQYRSNFYRHPSPRKMGEGRDLFGLKKDGTEFPVEISLSYYTVENKTFVIAFIIDISVRKKNEEIVFEQKKELEQIAKQVSQMNLQLEQKVEDRTKMLRETLAELEKSKDELSIALETEKELGELKTRFVTMASHEFRTPLSTILSSTFLLEKYAENTGDEKMQKHTQRIKNAVSGMKSILEDFLSLGKLEAGTIQTNITKLTAHECFNEIEETIHEMESSLKPGQKINFDHIGNKDLMLDKNLLRNILLNLISNAIKFSKENSNINITALINVHEFLISVKDNGIGISEEDKQHLFERFFRAKNAMNIQGTGLGLHIVTKYVSLMNGNIDFESELNKGTCFNVTIPLNL